MERPFREPGCKRKLRAPTDPAPYKHLQCQYYLEKKKRLCAMQRKKEFRYCTQHMVYDADSTLKFESVPCPLDPKHNVFTKDLEAHLLKCNARPAESHPVWYHRDINSGDVQECSESGPIDEDEMTKALLVKLVTYQFSPLPVSIKKHPGLNARMKQVGTKKHATQQSSLIGNLKEHNLLSSECFYVELGCGKAELSRFVNICIRHDIEFPPPHLSPLYQSPSYHSSSDHSSSNHSLSHASSSKQKSSDHSPSCAPTSRRYGFGFIDRGVNRMKSDNKIINEAGHLSPRVKRDRIDLKDLVLDKFLQDTEYEKVVAISKHLCGAATDLTLRMLLQLSLATGNENKFGGMFIAMCCRHACSWDLLLPESRSYLIDHGFENRQAFEILKKIASWAVSRIIDKNAVENEEKPDQHVTDETGNYPGRDNGCEREELGFRARRLLDESRVYALRQRLPNFKVNMFLYADVDVTLENVCLMVKPR